MILIITSDLLLFLFFFVIIHSVWFLLPSSYVEITLSFVIIFSFFQRNSKLYHRYVEIILLFFPRVWLFRPKPCLFVTSFDVFSIQALIICVYYQSGCPFSFDILIYIYFCASNILSSFVLIEPSSIYIYFFSVQMIYCRYPFGWTFTCFFLSVQTVYFHRSFSCVFFICYCSLHPNPKQHSLFIVRFPFLYSTLFQA